MLFGELDNIHPDLNIRQRVYVLKRLMALHKYSLLHVPITLQTLFGTREVARWSTAPAVLAEDLAGCGNPSTQMAVHS